MFRVSVGRLVCLIWAIAMPATAFAQAQAANGNIEGTVRDATGGAVPGVTVTLVNTDLGSSRSVVTNEQGFFRAPLLPLGNYTLTADMQGFRKHQQQGLTLSAGQTIVANIQLEVGGLELVPIEVSSEVGRVKKKMTGIWDTNMQNQNARNPQYPRGNWVFLREE